jgi:hypothetical protein
VALLLPRRAKTESPPAVTGNPPGEGESTAGLLRQGERHSDIRVNESPPISGDVLSGFYPDLSPPPGAAYGDDELLTDGFGDIKEPMRTQPPNTRPPR